MTDCPRCGYPLVWSDDRGALICCIYGTHTHRMTPPTGLPRGGGVELVALCIAATDDRPRAARTREYDRQRRHRLRAVS